MLFVVAVIALIVLVRPIWRLWVNFLVLFAPTQIWWLGIAPSNDREWLVDVAKLPAVTFDGDLVTLANVRNFHYRGENDFDKIWDTRTYDLSEVRGVDLYRMKTPVPIARIARRLFKGHEPAHEQTALVQRAAP